jgi:very-short-patch-repair endonuclease
MAAVLACGAGAALSHRSAAALWRILPRWHSPVEVIQHIAGHEVDAVFRPQHLVIELDSRQFHTTPRAFEQDRDRDADLLNAGFSTLRITDQRLKTQATKEAERLSQILSSRSS